MMKDYGGFAVVGSRPPSVLCHSRPSSALGPRPGYHTVARKSAVDESLFGSHHSTKLNEFINFKAPWEYPKPAPPRNTFGVPEKSAKDRAKDEKNKKQGRPLLWCPTPGTSVHNLDKTMTKKGETTKSSDQWNTRGRYAQLRHTPTFVDETLFGGGLQEPSFVAPWNERKKGEKKQPRPYLWDPTGGVEVDGHGGKQVSMSGRGHLRPKRPATALGLSRTSSKGGGPLPVWKP